MAACIIVNIDSIDCLFHIQGQTITSDTIMDL